MLGRDPSVRVSSNIDRGVGFQACPTSITVEVLAGKDARSRARFAHMITGSLIAEIASLVGELARATMLSALLDGRALTATELAYAARITPQTASSHLTKLTEAGLITPLRDGRYRYFRLHRRRSPRCSTASWPSRLNTGRASARCRGRPGNFVTRGFATTILRAG